MGSVGKADVSLQNFHLAARSGHDQVADMGGGSRLARGGDEEQMHRLGDDFSGGRANQCAVLKKSRVQGGEDHRLFAGNPGQMPLQLRGVARQRRPQAGGLKIAADGGERGKFRAKMAVHKNQAATFQPESKRGNLAGGQRPCRRLGGMQRQMQQRRDGREAPFLVFGRGKTKPCGARARGPAPLLEPGGSGV